MSDFRKLLKAEIFSELFSKAFLSGRFGRLVAFFFLMAYGFFKILAFAVSLAVHALKFTFGKIGLRIFETVSARLFPHYRKTFSKIKREAAAFGDAFETEDGSMPIVDGWKFAKVSGKGPRVGDFSAVFAVDEKSNAVYRAFVETEGVDMAEIAHHEIIFLARKRSGDALEILPEFFRNLRTNYL